MIPWYYCAMYYYNDDIMILLNGFINAVYIQCIIINVCVCVMCVCVQCLLTDTVFKYINDIQYSMPVYDTMMYYINAMSIIILQCNTMILFYYFNVTVV